MVEQSEVINLLVSLFLTFYLYFSIRKYHVYLSDWWKACIFWLILSDVFTVLEGYFMPVLLDWFEHISFMLGSLFFLLAVNFKRSFL